ncbi:P-loop containing nucleoside triphosphate hydrolase [Phytophthora cactorum]|nr:P-loop containing nucleoside triphosphate hydrolase [Phytophthora cactorum]
MFDKESLIQFVAGSGCFSIIQMILLIVLGALLVDNEHYHQLLGSSIRDVANKCLLLAQLTLLVFLLFFQTVMGGVALAASRAPGLALSYEAQVICLTVGKYEALSDKDKQTCQHFFRSDEFAGAMLVWQSYYVKVPWEVMIRALIRDNFVVDMDCPFTALPIPVHSQALGQIQWYPNGTISAKFAPILQVCIHPQRSAKGMFLCTSKRNLWEKSGYRCLPWMCRVRIETASSQVQAIGAIALAFVVFPPNRMEEIGLPPVVVDEEPLTDLYAKYKSLERHLEFLDIQEGYIKDEMKNLKRELIRAKEEVKRIQSVPLVIGQFLEMVDANYGIVAPRLAPTTTCASSAPNSSVALHRHSHAVVDVLPPESDSSIQMMQMSERPDVSYSDIGGMDIQKQEVREAVELPLTHFDLYKQIGVDPPRGVLIHAAKAVANATTAAFISVVGSEFVQKYLGEGPRMVRDVFRLAKENSPAIVFIDEVDAIATKRFDAQTGADREVQRILLELLNQMDGFDQATNVKVIMATNRADTLDPALLRPGRLDRKIEFPLPDRRQKRLIYQACTAKMNLGDEVDLEDYVNRPEKISSADIASICQEAGLQAVRKNRYVVLPKDFDKGYKNAIKRADTTFEFYH